MKTLALRALAWFTVQHIQWVLAQCLNDDGLYYAAFKIQASTGSVDLVFAMKELKK